MLTAAVAQHEYTAARRSAIVVERDDRAFVRVHGRDGEPAPLMLERLSTRFRIPPLLRGRWHLEQLTLAGLDVYLQRTAPDRFNVSDVVAHIAARPEGEPVAAVVEALLVTGSRVRLDDRAVEPAVGHRQWLAGLLDFFRVVFELTHALDRNTRLAALDEELGPVFVLDA